MEHSSKTHSLTDHLDLSVWPKRWLKLAVLSLALAGIFSIILVVARTPQLIAMFPQMRGLFEVSLVVHVDLSVLVWFLSMSSLLWSIQSYYVRAKAFPLFQGAAWGCMLLGTLLMAISPLTGEWEALKSNYIPVITNMVFFVSLGLILASLVIGLIAHARALPARDDTVVAGWGIYGSQISTLAAVACFIASGAQIPDEFSGVAFYEHLFWSGGHVLQFTYVQAMLVAWVIMAQCLGLRLPAGPVLAMMLLVGPFFALISFVPYLFFTVADQEHMDFFTLHMQAVLGIGGTVLGLWLLLHVTPHVLRGLRRPRHEDGETKEYKAVRSCLFMSLVLFFYGGLLGAMISGSNTQVPAHYHGSIVAVTLALMGLAYVLLPKMGYADVSRWRIARVQPWLYGIGQIMHISGLAYSGGYGVLRKTVGDTGNGTPDVMAALGIMGLGGLLAIIGGLLFVIVMVRGFRRSV